MRSLLKNKELNSIKSLRKSLKEIKNDFDDKIAHLRAIKSLDLSLALWELTSNSRKSIESKVENLSDTYSQEYIDGYYEGVNKVFERIYELLDENNISIDELII